jgi:hypothetical protein
MRPGQGFRRRSYLLACLLLGATTALSGTPVSNSDGVPVDPGPVTWARGRLPTPHGPLDVSWVQGHGKGHGAAVFTLAVTAPAGTSGDVAVPTGGGEVVVRVDGKVTSTGTGASAYQAAREGGYVTLHGLPAGSHTVTVVGA